MAIRVVQYQRARLERTPTQVRRLQRHVVDADMHVGMRAGLPPAPPEHGRDGGGQGNGQTSASAQIVRAQFQA